MALDTWGNGDLWGDGSIYNSLEGVSVEYVGNDETSVVHRLSVKVTYTAVIVPGASDVFAIHSIRPRLSSIAQAPQGYEAFADVVTPSERISTVVRHSGSELVISNIRLIAQRKKHQPKG